MQEYKRKLAAIFSADVAGYSRLMGDDEVDTVKTLTAYREMMYSWIEQHRGRVIDSPGDNLLAEFVSVVDAAQCAVAVQKEIQSRNSGLPENRRMLFRIGINLGDVIEEDDRIYGDGVNIAARLEAIADPGGICISKTAFDQIESKLPLGYEYIGEQTVKNISRPVYAYRVIMDPRVVSGRRIKRVFKKTSWKRNFAIACGVAVIIFIIFSIAGIFPRCTGPQTEKGHDQRPSIIILPFKNMSGDPNQEAFSDGITEELIHSLARVDGLRVISQTTSFSYKGKNLPISTIANELSVGYVLEGSVRKDENKIRITVQLISVADDAHLLSETYDREMKDIFNIQDEIAKAVVAKLKIKLLGNEIAKKEEYSIVEHERRIGINVKVNDGEIIRGGLLAIGVNIEMAGSVKGGLEAYGGHVVISGNSQNAVNFWGGDVTLSGNFHDNVKGSAGSLIISGTFEKNLKVDAEHITITPTAVIKGNLTYSGILDRKNGSQIAGEIKEIDKGDIAPGSFSYKAQRTSALSVVLEGIFGVLIFLVLGFFMNYFIPKQSERIVTVISTAPVLQNLKKGIWFLVITPFIILFSLISIIGIPFGFIYTALIVILFSIGMVCGVIWVGRRLLTYFHASFSNNFFISLITGFIVVEILSFIPYAGWLVKPFIFLVSAGSVWQVAWKVVRAERDAVDERNTEIA